MSFKRFVSRSLALAVVVPLMMLLTSVCVAATLDLESYGEPIFTVNFLTQPYPYTSLNATFANGVKGVTDGLELAPDWKPFSWLELWGTYSHLHMALHSKAEFDQASYVGGYEGSSPDHMATAQVLLTLQHGIQIDPDYRYMSGLLAQDAPAYQTADAHVAWKIKKHFRLSVDGRNLLQPAHREFLDDNNNQVGIKRQVYGGIAWIP